MKILLLAISHTLVGLAGFAAGIYLLPILIAPKAPTAAEVSQAAASASYRATFRRDLAGSDALHWGEGEVSVGPKTVVLRGRLAPGPDYKLYLVPKFVDTEAAFEATRASSLRIGDVKTFDNFIVALPEGVDLARYDTVLVWCETFSQFITAAKYR